LLSRRDQEPNTAVRIEMRDAHNHSIFGAIESEVVRV